LGKGFGCCDSKALGSAGLLSQHAN
jgi:hypothetical protein